MRLPLLLVALSLASPAAATVDVQAHRGGSWGLPENSLAAFRRALREGVSTLELDVQVTPSGELLVAHDPDFDASTAPRLREVLDLAAGAPHRARVSVEIKRQRSVPGWDAARLAGAVVDALRAAGLDDRACIQSFDPQVLAQVRTIAPRLETAVLVRHRPDFDEALRASRATILSPRASELTKADVARLASAGIGVVPWVVDDPEDARRFAQWGVAGLVTDHPLRILEALGQSPAAPVPEGGPMPARFAASALAAALIAAPLTAPPVAIAADDERRPERRRVLDVDDIDVVAVYPFTSGGNVDTFGTSLFVQEATEEEVFRDLVDPYELSITTPDGAPFQPQSVLPSLLEEARGKGADAILLGEGKWYDWGFRMELRLIEVEEGTVAWQGAYSSGFTISGPSAKRELARKAVRGLLKARKGDRR